MWACIHVDKYIHNIKTAKLIIENSAQASFRFSSISFRAPRMSLYIAYIVKSFYISFLFNIPIIFLKLYHTPELFNSW
jgi:hypothetical protein